MNKFFKVIFLFFLFLSPPTSAKDKPEPNVDDLFVTREGLLDEINKKRQAAENEYNNALKILSQKGGLKKGLKLLVDLEKRGHGGSKTTLDMIKNHKPDDVNEAYTSYNRELTDKLMRRAPLKQTAVQDKKENIKKTETKKEPVKSPVVKQEEIKEEELSRKSELSLISKEPLNKTVKKPDGKTLSSKKLKKEKENIENLKNKFSLVYHLEKNIETPFKTHNNNMLNTFAQKASKNDPEATFMLGLMAQDGVIVEKDLKSSLFYFEKACILNSYKACNNAGYFYRFGITVNVHHKKSEQYFLKAAVNQDAFAIYNLMSFYFYDGFIDNIKAYYFASLCLDRFNHKQDKKIIKQAKEVHNKSLKQMNFFQKKYIENYYPYALASLLNTAFKKNKIWAEPVSFPQNNNNSIVKINKIYPIRNPDKKTELLFLKWKYPVLPKNNFKIVKNDIPLPALSPNSSESVYGQMYRYKTPYQINIALVDKYSTVTARIGDKILINVYATIFGGDTQIPMEKDTNIRAKTGIGIITSFISSRIPMVKEQSYKDWIAYSYEIIEKGVGEITFSDISNEENSFYVKVLVD